MIPLIEISDLFKDYKMGTNTVTVLKGIQLIINKNEYVALMGPSGSGKSTLMNILGCLDTPTSGKYILNHIDVSSMQDDALASIRNKEIGFVFQQFNLLPRLTALENVALPLVYAGIAKKRREEQAMAMLEKVNLADRTHHKPNELSGGQCQRVAIARALVNNPSMILADEPTGNLQSAQADEIMQIFKKLNEEEKVSIIQVTHSEKNAAYAERVIHLLDGHVEREERFTR